MANRINVSHGSKEKFCYSDFLTFTKFPKDEIKCERLKQTDKTPCVKPHSLCKTTVRRRCPSDSMCNCDSFGLSWNHVFDLSKILHCLLNTWTGFVFSARALSSVFGFCRGSPKLWPKLLHH